MVPNVNEIYSISIIQRNGEEIKTELFQHKY